MGRIMAREPGLFDVDARLRELSAKGDDLERVNGLVDFEAFRLELEQAAQRASRLRLLVDEPRVFLELTVVAVAHGLLQSMDRLRSE